jgi:glycosyltransferase involved in cell wall biosynthesis
VEAAVEDSRLLDRKLAAIVRRRFPLDAHWWTTAALRKLQSDGIDVLGFVPDLSRHLDRLRLTVAPLRYGAGIKGKIATSLSHGVPCVVTPLGAEGMGLEHERNVLIAESPQEFAAAVVEELKRIKDEREALARLGFGERALRLIVPMVQRHFDLASDA